MLSLMDDNFAMMDVAMMDDNLAQFGGAFLSFPKQKK